MARAHAASACVQSDSIKGLAQSIAKPAYHRLLIAEPALRRAVPTLIIAFLITICLGAFVQVVDQTRQNRMAIKRDLAAIADLLSERLDRIAVGPAGSAGGARPAAKPVARAYSRLGHRRRPACHRHRRGPARPCPGSDRSAAWRAPPVSSTPPARRFPLAALGQQTGVASITLPGGQGALAIQHVVKSLPGQVIVDPGKCRTRCGGRTRRCRSRSRRRPASSC